MKKTTLSLLCLMLLTLCAAAAGPPQASKKETITIIGTIVGYDHMLGLIFSHPPFDLEAVVVRVDKEIRNKATDHYVYVVSSCVFSTKNLDPKIYNGQSTWTFLLERYGTDDLVVEESRSSLPQRFRWFDEDEALPLGTFLPGYKLISMERYPKRTENYYQIPYPPIRNQSP